jgi:hypothetical protein
MQILQQLWRVDDVLIYFQGKGMMLTYWLLLKNVDKNIHSWGTLGIEEFD